MGVVKCLWDFTDMKMGKKAGKQSFFKGVVVWALGMDSGISRK